MSDPRSPDEPEKGPSSEAMPVGLPEKLKAGDTFTWEQPSEGGPAPEPRDAQHPSLEAQLEHEDLSLMTAAEPELPPPPPGAPPQPGPVDQAPGRYRSVTEDIIGEGGMGRIVPVLDSSLGREVARKELWHSEKPLWRKRFLREAQITAQLEHPSIVPIYELGRDDQDQLYYTMKYVRGVTLSDALSEVSTLEDRLKLLGPIIDVCYALAYAHDRGILHRDIKPQNIMLGPYGETVLLDWGLAQRHHSLPAETEPGRLSPVTVTGEPERIIMGTPHYMSPEQASKGGPELTPAADVWSLGATLYQVLASKPPLGPGKAREVLERARRAEVRPLLEVAPELPSALAAVVMKCLEARPEDRYRTTTQLAQEIESWRVGDRVDAYTYSSLELMTLFGRRHARVLSVIALALVVILFTLSSSYQQNLHERNRAVEAEERAQEALRKVTVRSLSARAQEALQREQRGTALALFRASSRLGEESGSLDTYGAIERLSLGRVLPRLLSPAPRGSVGKQLPSLSPDGERLVTQRAGELGVWPLQGGGESQAIQLDPGSVSALAWSPEGSRLVVAGRSGDWRGVSLLDASGEERRLELDIPSYSALAISKDGRWLAAAGLVKSEILLWDIERGELSCRLGSTESSDLRTRLREELRLGSHRELTFLGESGPLLMGRSQGWQLWDPESCSLREERTESFLDWTHSEGLLYSSLDGIIIEHDLREGSERPLLEPDHSSSRMVWSPDRRWVSLCSQPDRGGHQRLTVYSLPEGELRHSWNLTAEDPCEVSFSPDGSFMAQRRGGQVVWLRDLETGHTVDRFKHSGVQGMRWLPDPVGLVTFHLDGSVLSWHLPLEQRPRSLQLEFSAQESELKLLAADPSGRWMALRRSHEEREDHQELLLLDIPEGELVSLGDWEESICQVRFSADSLQLAMLMGDSCELNSQTTSRETWKRGFRRWDLQGEPRLTSSWDSPSPEAIRAPLPGSITSTAMDIAPDLQSFALVDYNDCLFSYQADEESPPVTHCDLSDRALLRALRILPADQGIALGSSTHYIRLRPGDPESIRTTPLLGRLQELSPDGLTVSVLKDEQILLAPDLPVEDSSEGGLPETWIGYLGRNQVMILEQGGRFQVRDRQGTAQHSWQLDEAPWEGWVSSPQGDRVAAFTGRSVSVWDLASGLLLSQHELQGTAVTQLIFSGDGSRLFARTRTQSIFQWYTRPLDPAQIYRESGQRSNYRVCEGSESVRPVLPHPRADSIWVEAADCP